MHLLPFKSLAQEYWPSFLGIAHSTLLDTLFNLLDTFVDSVVAEEPNELASLQGKGAILLANHQVAVESVLLSVIAAALFKVPVAAIAKQEHQETWIGKYAHLSTNWPGPKRHKAIYYFDRSNPAQLLDIIKRLRPQLTAGELSLLVHPAGTRSLSCRVPLRNISSVIFDLAISARAPLIPVRITGGLPVIAAPQRQSFPLGLGKQRYWIGRSIPDNQLRKLSYVQRPTHVIDAMNRVGPSYAVEEPSSSNSQLIREVAKWLKHSGAGYEASVIGATLALGQHRCPQSQRLLAKFESGNIDFDESGEDSQLKEIAELLMPNMMGKQFK